MERLETKRGVSVTSEALLYVPAGLEAVLRSQCSENEMAGREGKAEDEGLLPAHSTFSTDFGSRTRREGR